MIYQIKNKVRNLTYFLLLIGGAASIQSCSYLDVVPDKIGTIDNSFINHNEAEKYLNTCYSYTPGNDSPHNNVALMGADELWSHYPLTPHNDLSPWKVALGRRNVNDPLCNMWYVYYRGTRDRNIFLENVSDMSKVGDLTPFMRKRRLAEVEFLRAYYHLCLFRMYGPIVIADDNLPISATPEEVRRKCEPVDKVAQYIVDLLDECLEDLPRVISNKGSELGRVTQIADLTLKARLLVTAASPLFDGNKDYANYVDKDGGHLFNSTEDPTKWDTAIIACEAAIEASQGPELGLELYSYKSNLILSDETKCQFNIRNSVTEKWNTKLIWGLSSRSDAHLQSLCIIRIGVYPNNTWGGQKMLNPTMGATNLYYTKNGIPVGEDRTWNYADRFKAKMYINKQPYELASYYRTIQMNFDKEPRFYVNIGFGGRTWYQYNCPSDSEKDIQTAKNHAGQAQGRLGTDNYTTTGHWTKKLVSVTYEVIQSSYTTERFPWPEMRLTDLYLPYVEALNGRDDANNRELAIGYLDQIRTHAGLKGIKKSWDTYSKYPSRYKTQEGLREIIQCECAIELMFEGSRFWDLRRWKTVNKVLSEKIHEWNFKGKTPAEYYPQRTLYTLGSIAPRDYFWPIHQNDLVVNPKLVQNSGW